MEEAEFPISPSVRWLRADKGTERMHTTENCLDGRAQDKGQVTQPPGPCEWESSDKAHKHSEWDRQREGEPL